MEGILLHDVHDVVVRGGVYHYTITKWSTKLSACVNTLRQDWRHDGMTGCMAS